MHAALLTPLSKAAQAPVMKSFVQCQLMALTNSWK
jgi:hypothetical protein